MKRVTSTRTRRAAQTLGEHVQVWRKLLGMTTDDIAMRAGVARSTYSRLERGEIGVSMETFLNVVGVFGQIDRLLETLDPYETDLGRARADQQLPKRVRR